MEKKRSIGVTVFAIFVFIIGLVVLYYFSYVIRVEIPRLVSTNQVINPWDSPVILLYPTIGISFIVSGISVFKLRNWGRIFSLWLMTIYSLIGLFVTFALFALSMSSSFYTIAFWSVFCLIFFVLPAISSFVLFMHPKVKEQFR